MSLGLSWSKSNEERDRSERGFEDKTDLGTGEGAQR
jgi:hypothetical protein